MLNWVAPLGEARNFAQGEIAAGPAKDEAAQIFQDISAELQHTYLLAYRPPEAKDDGWRQIQVSLSGSKDYKDCTVRSKEGYYPN
jgi:hypothetical protein